MRKNTRKFATVFASIVLGVSTLFGGVLWEVSANELSTDRELSTSALITNVTDEFVTPAGEVTLTSGKTDTLTGLLIKPNSYTEAWNVDLNVSFTDNASITYFLPSQFGSNNDFVANGFSVKNSKGEIVATFVLGNPHWASYGSGKAYVYNALNDTYTTARTYWNASTKYNEYDPSKAPVILTPNAGSLYGLSTFGDEMYVSPKVGNQISTTALDLDSVFGTVYFEYADGVLDVKTTTYDVSERAAGGENASGNGQTILLGSVEVDLSAGYTIEMGSSPTIKVSDTETYTAPYSSAILISKINGVDVSTENISAQNGDVTDIQYESEKNFNGKNVIYTREGQNLNRFAVYGKFLAGGGLMSQSSAEIYRVSASDTFADKEPGEYPLTVTAGSFSKNYTVIVQKEYEVLSSSVITATENAKITPSVVAGDYKGLYVDRISASKARTAKINGTFTGNSSITFLFDGSVASKTEAHAFNVYNANGEKVASAVHYYVQAWQGIGARMYLHNVLENVYTKPSSSGGYETMTALGNSAYQGVNVSPIPYTTNERINYDGTFYDVDTATGTLYFEYDEEDKTLTVKITTPQKTRLTPDEERNYQKDSEGNILTDTAGNPILKKENLTSPNPIVTVGVIENVDLSDGYSIELSDPTDFKAGDNQFTSNSSPIVLVDINGVIVAEEKTKAVAGDIVKATHLGEVYAYGEGETGEEVLYIAQNGSLDGIEVKAKKTYADGWFDFVNSNKAEIEGDYDLTKAGTYEVELVAVEDGIDYSRTLKLVVEQSDEVKFDVNGGLPLSSVYVSENSWKHQIPTPERFGWKFMGWFNGEEQVTEITKDIGTVTLKAKWLDDVSPVLSLNGLEDLTVVDKKSDFILSATDVIAEDMAWGVLADTAITIYVKEPNAQEFVAYNDYVFNGTLFGEYEIKYVAIDGSMNSAEITRTLKYMPTRPILTVNGEVVKSGFVGKEIVLPSATATSGANSIKVDVSVTFNNENVNVSDNKFTPNEAGVYTVTYAATNENGLVAVKAFEVKIIADSEAPTLNVDFTTKEMKVGEKLTLPSATATDDADENVQIDVVVKKGTKVVATDSVVLNEVGVYTVVYTATDFSGKKSSLTFEVFVKGEPTENNGGADNTPAAGTSFFSLIFGGCNSSASLGVCGSVAMLATLVLINKKKKK